MPNHAGFSASADYKRTEPTSSASRYGSRLDHLPEIEPSDSASNAGFHHRKGSYGQRPLSGLRSGQDRRSEKHIYTNKEHIQVSSRSVPRTLDRSGSLGRAHREARHTVQEPASNGVDAIQTADTKASSQLAWHPQASFVKNTKAPLASRVSAPPLANLLPEILQPVPLAEMSGQQQEAAIVDDLLFVLMGYEGQYIRFTDRYTPTDEKCRLVGPQYRLLPGLDPSLRDLTRSMLKMASHYIAVEAFVEVQSRNEFGSINHALCASIRKLLKEYLVMVAQLEHLMLTKDNFTLHVLHIHVMPTTNTMFQLYSLAQELLKKNQILEEVEEEESSDDDDVDKIIEKLNKGGNLAPGTAKKIYKGGNVLRLLTHRLARFSGDPAARKVLEDLLRDASKPYVSMLNEWVHHGTIKDPHGEFLIRERTSIGRDHLDEDFTDEYWEKRYTIRDGEIPPQLEGVKDKVLLAGKYLNVVRECGGVDVSQKVQDVPRTFDDANFLNNITDAYSHANASLLDLLTTKHELTERLRSMKHYFFLDKSDFFTYFVFLGRSELRKNASDVNVGKLQSLLDLVLRQPGSVASEDPYIDDVKVAMNDQPLTKFLMSVVNIHGFEEGEEPSFRRDGTPAARGKDDDGAKMTGYDAFELKYTVPFPLSLVISSKTVVRYQILFRYLVSLKHAEGVLVSSWEDHNKLVSWTHRSQDRPFAVWKRRVWTLRGRMLNFVEQCLYYCTAEVIEPRWHELMQKVKDVETTYGNASLPFQDELAEGRRQGSGRLFSKTVDELMHDHVDFLDTCLKECMLMNPKLLKVRDKIIWTCAAFAGWTSKLSRDICAADQSLAGTAPALEYLEDAYKQVKRPVPEQYKAWDPEALGRMNEMLTRYEDNFNRHMKILLDVLDYFAATETVALGRLCAQLIMANEKGGEGRTMP